MSREIKLQSCDLPKVVGHDVVGHDVTGALSLGHNVLGHDVLGQDDGNLSEKKGKHKNCFSGL